MATPQTAEMLRARAALLHFDLPVPVEVREVAGGLQHRLLRVNCDGGQNFALKILAPRAVATFESRQKFERAEELAQVAAQHEIPAVFALIGKDGARLQQVGGEWVALYAWHEGQVLPPQGVETWRARVMGAHLGRLHALQVRFPEQKKPTPEAFGKGHFKGLSRMAKEQRADFSSRLSGAIEELEQLNTAAMIAQLALQEGWTSGHLDFDQKNVLWDQQDKPLILDWEQAKPIHPALEAMGAGLSWAGQSAGEASRESFLAFLEGYRAQNELQLRDLETAVDGVLGKWIIWLEFNLVRLLDTQNITPHERQIAFDAGMHALGATLQLGRDGEKYRSWCREAFGLGN